MYLNHFLSQRNKIILDKYPENMYFITRCIDVANAPLAQLVEQRTLNPFVQGSSP